MNQNRISSTNIPKSEASKVPAQPQSSEMPTNQAVAAARAARQAAQQTVPNISVGQPAGGSERAVAQGAQPTGSAVQSSTQQKRVTRPIAGTAAQAQQRNVQQHTGQSVRPQGAAQYNAAMASARRAEPQGSLQNAAQRPSALTGQYGTEVNGASTRQAASAARRTAAGQNAAAPTGEASGQRASWPTMSAAAVSRPIAPQGQTRPPLQAGARKRTATLQGQASVHTMQENVRPVNAAGASKSSANASSRNAADSAVEAEKQAVSKSIPKVETATKKTRERAARSKRSKWGEISFKWKELIKRWGALRMLACLTAVVMLVSGGTVFTMLYGFLFSRKSEVDLPNFYGKRLSDVQSEKAYSSFDIEYEEVYTDKAAVGIIFAQTPKAPRQVKENAHIQLSVSAGAQKVDVPNVTGLTRDAAKETLKNAGLNLIYKPTNDSTVTADTVLHTVPAAGETINAGDTVQVYISRDENIVNVTVPQCVGAVSLADASRLLTEAGLIYELSPDSGTDGAVTAQLPLADERVPRGTKVVLTLNGAGATGLDTLPVMQITGADGHLHEYEASQIVPSNEYSIGYTVFVCKVCGYFYYGDFTQPGT